MLRKTRGMQAGQHLAATASMRPQRNAAENKVAESGHAGRAQASMRPQRNAAENLWGGR